MTNRLVNQRLTLIIGLSTSLFFLGGLVIQVIVPNETVTVWTLGIFAAFALLGLVLIAAYFLEFYELSDDGMVFRNFLGIKKSLRWADLSTVRYSSTMKWFRLKTRSGSSARLSVMLTGLPEFARLLQHRAPRSAIDDRTLELLRAIGGGVFPRSLTDIEVD